MGESNVHVMSGYMCSRSLRGRADVGMPGGIQTEESCVNEASGSSRLL